MSSVNKVILIGNLGKDPEVKYLENNLPLAKISIATSETWKDKTTGEKKEHTDWHNVVLWRKSAEFVEKYVKKGDKVYVEGKIKTRKYEDKEGVTKYITEVVADTITILSSKRTPGTVPDASAAEPANVAEPETVTENSTDDLPF